jgi:hypothetical protein
MRKTMWIVLIGVLILTACGQAGIKIIPHPTPEIKMDLQPFYDIGCNEKLDNCNDNPMLKPFGCDRLDTTLLYMGGLGVPMIECKISQAYHNNVVNIEQMEKEHSYFFMKDCSWQSHVRYIVYRNGQFELIESMDKLRAAFVPIDSPEKALSYAIAATGNFAYYDGLAYDPKMKYYDEKPIEMTHVVETNDGYLVNLFNFRTCGCGPHDMGSVTVTVSKDGEVSAGDRVPLYEDTSMEGMCVD